MSHPVQRRWYPIAFAIAALVLLPLSVLVLSWHEIDGEIWSHLWDTQMPRLLGNTLVLVFGVGIGVTLLGVSLAWLTSLCEFPGRRWLDWALMLPFAIPAYVLAFVFIGLFDFSGPVQSLLREWFGTGIRLPRVRSTGGVITVLVLVFYPYVYLLARSAFLAQGRGLLEAARVLGQSPWQAFWRVALPMAWPAIGAGLALAIMETLADFGAVAVFNFDTFTTAIYKTWYGFYSLSGATQLASLLLLAVMLVLYGERRARGASRPASERPRGKALYRLHGWKALAASGWCGLVFVCAFVVPLLQLLAWFWQRGRFDLDERYAGLILHTLSLGALAALITVSVALLLAFARRQAPTRPIRSAVSLANLGYALPGSVLAVSIMLAFSFLDRELVIPLSSWLGGAGKPLLLGSLAALLLAYLVRFMAVAYGPLENGLARIRPSLPQAARSLGVGGPALFLRVYLPLLVPGALSAALLVFVDVLKEMPATLLMRPFGWDTLSVRIFEMTSEGEWARAALPALTLVVVGLLPVIGLIRRSARQPGH
ncbi:MULTISPECIES: iron ABC transporter permease [unclassified Pseudomonas]|uniref:ABC transporter permease n=1 Tax=unclassified Pseudomonas TaxID=196821 RepID=UPI00244A96B8|nr:MULTISPECIES: iron ABC transporter permease [unclassified Pseudomonas]MDG9923238.1 iron ABC transporter permease [Pseudomonas sp. GD04045]MDH0034685.1 iron ABC transporter permease [Pseudomonas sp. GD04019]